MSADKVNILIVDDLPEKVLVLQSILEELGENVVVAYSGTEALRQVLAHDFAVILLDVNMPDIDGFETAMLIRGRKKSAHTPIIFVTAYADEFHTARGYSLGAVDYILAPVVPEILRTKVKVFVDLFRMNQQIQRQAEQRVALARAQAARIAAEEVTRRSTFLAEASKVVGSSLDFKAILSQLAGLAVPFLADLCAATHVDSRSRAVLTELAWVEAPDQIGTRTLPDQHELPAPLRAATERVLATGKLELLEDLVDRFEGDAGNGRHDSWPGLVLRAALVLPLQARGRTLGVLTLALGPSGRRHGAADIALAEELTSRAALALDNACLYQGIQEADQHKNDFLAMLAHELRNPLAPVRNAVEILRLLGPGAPSLVQARDMIDRQVTHMTRVIDDLLDMSRIARGKILLRSEHLDLVPLVRGVVEDYRSSLEGTGLTFELELPDEPLWLMGDPTRLAQVVGNVLHNANKFTDPGGTVFVALGRAPDTQSARLTIRDTGIGMEPAMLERLFDTFSQADRSLDRSRGGLGLGLALVKGLVAAHGGVVTAHSDGLGKGTAIIVDLPLAAQPASEPSAPAAPAPEKVACRILVIEDQADAAESMRMLLTLTGHQVQVARTGRDALSAARAFRPDAVLCDIGLPGGMDGYAVARALRRDVALTSAYLIALSGYGQDGDKRRACEAGFDVHLTKPVDYGELQQLLGDMTTPK